jgi:hypothetical protein
VFLQRFRYPAYERMMALVPASSSPSNCREAKIETFSYNALFVALKGRIAATAPVESTDKPAELRVKALPMSVQEPGDTPPSDHQAAPLWQLSHSPLTCDDAE